MKVICELYRKSLIIQFWLCYKLCSKLLVNSKIGNLRDMLKLNY